MNNNNYYNDDIMIYINNGMINICINKDIEIEETILLNFVNFNQ